MSGEELDHRAADRLLSPRERERIPESPDSAGTATMLQRGWPRSFAFQARSSGSLRGLCDQRDLLEKLSLFALIYCRQSGQQICENPERPQNKFNYAQLRRNMMFISAEVELGKRTSWWSLEQASHIALLLLRETFKPHKHHCRYTMGHEAFLPPVGLA